MPKVTDTGVDTDPVIGNPPHGLGDIVDGLDHRNQTDSNIDVRKVVGRKPAELARQELEALRDEDAMTPDLVFRDPYVLDFLGFVQ